MVSPGRISAPNPTKRGTRKDKSRIIARQLIQYLNGLVRERHAMNPVAFHTLCRDRAHLGFKVDLIPTPFQRLGGASRSQDRKP